MSERGVQTTKEIDLDELERLACAAAAWMPDDPWSRSRHCYSASLGYVAGADLPSAPPQEVFQDVVDPNTVLALIERIRKLEGAQLDEQGAA